MNLRVVTYNLHKGLSVGNSRLVLSEIKEALKPLSCDLVLLQEIQGEHLDYKKKFAGWPEESQYEYLADQLWSHYAYAKNAIYKKGHHGNALLSRFPLHSENINLSKLPQFSRSLLHGVIALPDPLPPLHVICAHFGLWRSNQQKHAETLITRIQKEVPANAPLIFGGDLNDWSGKLGAFIARALDMHEVHDYQNGAHAKTFPAWWPMLALDRLYFRNLDLVTCQSGPADPWRKLSDHLPLIAEFRVPPPHATR